MIARRVKRTISMHQIALDASQIGSRQRQEHPHAVHRRTAGFVDILAARILPVASGTVHAAVGLAVLREIQGTIRVGQHPYTPA